MNRIIFQIKTSLVALILLALTYGDVAGQQFSFWQTPAEPTFSFEPWDAQSYEQIEMIIRGQDSGGQGGGGGDLASDATNPTSNLTQYQVQNTFIPSTYEASGFAHTLSLQMVKPFETATASFRLGSLAQHCLSSQQLIQMGRFPLGHLMTLTFCSPWTISLG